MKNKNNKKESFQWVKGDNYGQIEILENEVKIDNEEYILFESGKQINKKLKDEYLVKLEDPNLPIINPNSKLIETNLNKIKEDLLYPTEDEIKNKTNSLGVVNMGSAKNIPHPDDIVNQNITNNPLFDPFLSGIPIDGKINKTYRDKTNYTDYYKPLEVISTKTINKEISQFEEIINKSKKTEVTLKLNIKANIPIKNFFSLFDDEYIEKNKDAILNEIINIIKQTDLDVQLKENLIKIYNLNSKENV